jgi:Ca-activated chloride channel family protein
MTNVYRYILILAAAVFSGSVLMGGIVSYAQQSTPNPVAGGTPKAVGTPPVLDQSDDVIEIDTEVVNVLFTAQDEKRRLVTTLKPEDINVFENGKRQDIIAFARQVDLPLSLTILIDTSHSQIRTLPDEKEAAKSFLESVVRPTKDEVAIVSFSGEATLEQGMTNNIARLRRAIDRVTFEPPSGYVGGGIVVGTVPAASQSQASASTAIWDAVLITSDEILGPAPEGIRRAIILLSDGANTSGKNDLDAAIKAALKSEAVLYSIGIGDNFYKGVDKPALRKISENTGGKAFFPRDEAELREAFQQIQEEMRSQYLVAYEPIDQEQDGAFRKINIQLVNERLKSDKIQLTHRDGYFAKSNSN